MQKLEKALEQLIAEIKDTDIYKEYKLQRDIIIKHPALMEKIDEFRQRNYEIQNSEDQDDVFEAMDKFEKEYEQFREDPLVNDFLEAEVSICRMIQGIGLKITEAIDFE